MLRLPESEDAERATVLRQQYESQRRALMEPLIGGELGEKY
jgi:hypothetical protein